MGGNRWSVRFPPSTFPRVDGGWADFVPVNSQAISALARNLHNALFARLIKLTTNRRPRNYSLRAREITGLRRLPSDFRPLRQL